MTRGVRWFLAGCVALAALAGCGRSYFEYGEREPWRRAAELACLNSGTVREGAGVVRIGPIEGPGICGAEFPLKVTALGESPVLGYAGEVIRPPGLIPNASPAATQPRWPISRQPYGAPPPAQQSMPPDYPPPHQAWPPRQLGAPPSDLRAPPHWQPRSAPPGSIQSQPLPAPAARAQDDVPEELPRYGRPGAAPIAPAPNSRPLPRLGPQRSPVLAAMPVEVQPAATLACPIVSALDHWIAGTVQPSAQKWFGRPVAEIKQISAYSCRGMNGQPGARISEHAFGNALDIAAFVLADGHRITVKGGWRGSPEEQGFLRDVQGSACDQFTTVLAPGSNAFHYDHIHVDLMRRANGRRICEPGAVDGELIAARARRNPALAARQRVPPTRRYDPPFNARNDPFAWRGDARRGDPATTGSIATRRAGSNPASDDNDWIEEPGPRPPIDWRTDRHKPR